MIKAQGHGERLVRAAVISIAMLLTAVPSLVEAVELSTVCTAKSVAEFNPPAESGTLLLQAVANPLAEGRAAPAVRVLQPPLDQAMLSPNGEYIAGTRRHDNRANPTGSYTTVVINREFELVYEGASAFAEFSLSFPVTTAVFEVRFPFAIMSIAISFPSTSIWATAIV